MKRMDIPAAWIASAQRILKNRWHKILVVGATDRGKSTYCRFLLGYLRETGARGCACAVSSASDHGRGPGYGADVWAQKAPRDLTFARQAVGWLVVQAGYDAKFEPLETARERTHPCQTGVRAVRPPQLDERATVGMHAHVSEVPFHRYFQHGLEGGDFRFKRADVIDCP